MSMTFSAAAIAALVFDIVFAIALPVGMLLYLRKRYGCGIKCFFIGAGVFLLFVLVLENLAHAVVAASPLKPVLMGDNYWAFGLYGGLMAGLFEEFGRFAAFHTVLKKQRDKDYNALMYGAGHGGIEVMIVMLPTMITYLVYVILINTGNGAVLTSGLDAATMETVQTTMQSVAAPDQPGGTDCSCDCPSVTLGYRVVCCEKPSDSVSAAGHRAACPARCCNSHSELFSGFYSDCGMWCLDHCAVHCCHRTANLEAEQPCLC